MPNNFTRGATVSFAIVFRDADGAVTSPGSANLFLNFKNAARSHRDSVQIALAESDGAWRATWDSRVASYGQVYGHARTAAGVPLSGSDFSFGLTANPANPT